MLALLGAVILPYIGESVSGVTQRLSAAAALWSSRGLRGGVEAYRAGYTAVQWQHHVAVLALHTE